MKQHHQYPDLWIEVFRVQGLGDGGVLVWVFRGLGFGDYSLGCRVPVLQKSLGDRKCRV